VTVYNKVLHGNNITMLHVDMAQASTIGPKCLIIVLTYYLY